MLSDMENIDLKTLAEFLIKAKKVTYASGSEANIPAQRPGFKELEFKEGEWEYRDSYSGFFRAPGQEIVRFRGVPVWSMSYDGGMLEEFWGNEAFAKQTFSFLKKALMSVPIQKPFGGPENLKEGDYEYIMDVEGNITSFKGTEKILFKGKVVFVQHFMGGLIVGQ